MNMKPEQLAALINGRTRIQEMLEGIGARESDKTAVVINRLSRILSLARIVVPDEQAESMPTKILVREICELAMIAVDIDPRDDTRAAAFLANISIIIAQLTRIEIEVRDLKEQS